MIKGLFLPVTLNLKLVSYELKAVSAPPPPPFRPKTKTKQIAIDGLQSTTFLSWRKPGHTLQKQLRGSKPLTTRIMMMQQPK